VGAICAGGVYLVRRLSGVAHKNARIVIIIAACEKGKHEHAEKAENDDGLFFCISHFMFSI
jgi:hypothetical protein